MEIAGVAHVILTVSNFEAAVPFYEKLLAFLGMKKIFKGEEFLYFLGARTGLGISR
jgi:catechol 2,3-dioxygenase-like lactoylglutathione lyase family enzyme